MIKHQAIVMRNGVEKVINHPEGFADPFQNGKYYKPMKDDKLIGEVVRRLTDKSYSHYRLPGSIQVSLE